MACGDEGWARVEAEGERKEGVSAQEKEKLTRLGDYWILGWGSRHRGIQPQ